MNLMTTKEPIAVKRVPIARATLELALAETVRDIDECKGLIAIIVERIVPTSSGGPNWILKGIKYGKAPRRLCDTEIARCVAEGQAEFEIVD
jgi:hypothetical protein